MTTRRPAGAGEGNAGPGHPMTAGRQRKTPGLNDYRTDTEWSIHDRADIQTVGHGHRLAERETYAQVGQPHALPHRLLRPTVRRQQQTAAHTTALDYTAFKPQLSYQCHTYLPPMLLYFIEKQLPQTWIITKSIHKINWSYELPLLTNYYFTMKWDYLLNIFIHYFPITISIAINTQESKHICARVQPQLPRIISVCNQ